MAEISQGVASVPNNLVEALPKPRPMDFKEVKVKIGVTQVMQSYLDALYASMATKATFQGVKAMPFTSDELIEYCVLILRARISYVNQEKVTPDLHPKSRIAVPAFFTDVLSNIGKADAKSLGLVLTPVFDVEIKSSMKVDQIKAISMFLKNMSNYGFVMSDGYSADRYGSFAFMAMQLVGNEMVAANDDAHPVYALLASVVIKTQLMEVLQPRVVYASIEELRYAAERLAEPRGASVH